MDAALWGFLGTLVGGAFTILGAFLTNRSRAQEASEQRDADKQRIRMEQQHADEVAERERRAARVDEWRRGIAESHRSYDLWRPGFMDAPQLPSETFRDPELRKHMCSKTEWFLSLRPHLDDAVAEKCITVDGPTASILAREVARIERQWGLV